MKETGHTLYMCGHHFRLFLICLKIMFIEVLGCKIFLNFFTAD